MRTNDSERRLDAADARRIKMIGLESRKQVAFRVIESGGTMKDAAAAARADTRTVRRWLKELRT